MNLIVHSGQARSLAFEALSCARNGDFTLSKKRLAESKEASKAAHQVQTALIGADEGQGKISMTLVMVHAQDHLMNAMLAQDLIEEMIHLYQRIEK
ncbi:PTS lactose/cellobiose transporter subunit IIA [Candidatus Sororendozoicomonas aggregata]|uniref:PTS lactose/cellobiose transporter subunit IIA n=1 Tax=Candidatus Sororendozoicomonas aggregata TaxID=3073239 RepID=UPI003B75C3EC